MAALRASISMRATRSFYATTGRTLASFQARTTATFTGIHRAAPTLSSLPFIPLTFQHQQRHHRRNAHTGTEASQSQSSHQSNSKTESDSRQQSQSGSGSRSNTNTGNENARQTFRARFTAFFSRLYGRYNDLLDTYPYRTQMATSGFLGGAGDATTQWFEHRWDVEEGRMPKPWDFRRLFAVAFFGVYFMGPIGHIWYEKLDIFCHRFARSKAAMIGIKVFGDTCVFGPFCLWAFFVSVSLMEGISWRATEQKIRRDFVPTYLVDYSMWPLVQALNFRYIPVQHQLLVVNLMCYFDDIFLSYVQHNSLPKIFQVIEDWWERVLVEYGWDADLHELTAMEEADDRARKQLWDEHLRVQQLITVDNPALRAAPITLAT